MKVAISNFSAPSATAHDSESFWSRHVKPPKRARVSLFEQNVGWGFHIQALGVYLLDTGLAEEVEFWDFTATRSMEYEANGLFRIGFLGADDLTAYLERHGYPDLFINHGRHGHSTLDRLAGRSFRVHVPALRSGLDRTENFGAECYLVDSDEYLDDRSMLYVPVVNTRRIHPAECAKERDFVYLAACYPGKRHDIVVSAVKGRELTGHFHPVSSSHLDLSDTNITTSDWDELDVVDLLRSSRMAVYPGDKTSNPAAMWECVAAGLPIVVNRAIRGGKHLVVPGVTGELASESEFSDVMEHVLARLDSYSPGRYFEQTWDTVELLDSYLAFFERMGLAT